MSLNSRTNFKNAEWPPENSAEVDAKVSAVLNITEDDASLSADPAKAYYTTRPDLVNLVEEFDQNHQAPVERQTYFSSEIHQNIAPALQSQSEALFLIHPDTPDDLHGRSSASWLGTDHLASFTRQGGLEFDDAAESQFYSPKATDDIEVAEHKVSSASSENDHPLSHRDRRDLTRIADASSAVGSKEEIRTLEDEKKVLLMKSGEDEVNISHLKPEVLSLQRKPNSQEAENILTLGGKKTGFENVQDELAAAQNSSASAAGRAGMKGFLGAQGEGPCEEVSPLHKGKNQQVQKNIATHLRYSSMLKDGTSQFQEEENAGQDEFADLQSETTGHFLEPGDAKQSGRERKFELLELSAVVESLKQSLAAKELENSNLIEDLQKLSDHQSSAEKRYLEEVSFLQSEELKWRTEAADTSTLMAEKVASLRMENANLHRDLSVKIEFVLSQQKEMESLSEECQNLSQALQRMSVEMLDLRNDLEIYKDVVISSMEERAVEQEDKIQDLTVTNERHEDEISRLKAELKDAKSDLLRAQERSSTLEMELIVNVEMLKHVIGLFEASKTQSIALSDKLGLQEEEHGSLEQMLATVTNENKLFSNKLAWVVKERDCFAAEMRWLVAMLADVEQLQRELTSARMGTPVARHTDIGGGSPANFYDLSDQQRGVNAGAGEPLRPHHQNVESTQFPQEGLQVPASAVTLSTEEGDWDLKTKQEFSAKGEKTQQASGPVDSDLGSSSTTQSSSSLCVIDKLKEEITCMQMSIQKLEAAVADRESQDSLSTTHENLCNPDKNSTISSASILAEDDVQGGSDKIQNLSEENHSLRAENASLKADCQAARIEWTLLQDTMRDLEASKLILQEKNDHLYSVADSDKRDTLKLQDQFIQLQQTYSTLLQDVEASHEQRKKSEETLHMLDDVIGSLESSNRRLHVENGLKAEELKNLRDILANVHNEGAGGVAELRTKMAEAFDELKTMIIDCSGKMEDNGVFQFSTDSESLAVLELPHQNVTNVSIESSDESRMPEVTPDTRARCRHFLTELKSTVEEANVLVEVLLGVRKMVSMCLESSEHDGGTSLKPTDEILMKRDERVRRTESCSIEKDPDSTGSVHQHMQLAGQLQAFIDTKLEHEFLELKQGRNKLKKDLALQFDEVQKMEIELQKFEILVKSDGRITQEERQGKKRRAEECVTELQGMLAELRVQVHRMRKEIVSEEDEDAIGVEGQVTVLVSTNSAGAPSMDVWKGKLMKEVEGLRLLNKRLYAELQTIRQDLENMATMIKSAHGHLLQESPSGEEEIESIFDLRTQKSDTSGLRAQNSRESTDSQQQLLFASPQMVEGDLVSIHRTGSEDSPRQFPLKPRNFGFTWFMLLFSPDRKVSNIIRGKTGKEVSPSSRGSRRSGRANATLVMDSGRRKLSGCWTCTSRLDSFDHR